MPASAPSDVESVLPMLLKSSCWLCVSWLIQLELRDCRQAISQQREDCRQLEGNQRLWGEEGNTLKKVRISAFRSSAQMLKQQLLAEPLWMLSAGDL